MLNGTVDFSWLRMCVSVRMSMSVNVRREHKCHAVHESSADNLNFCSNTKSDSMGIVQAGFENLSTEDCNSWITHCEYT